MASSSSSSSIANTNTATTTPPTTLTTIHYLITNKLTRDNLLWIAQIISYLKGQHLYGYLDGITPLPS